MFDINKMQAKVFCHGSPKAAAGILALTMLVPHLVFTIILAIFLKDSDSAWF